MIPMIPHPEKHEHLTAFSCNLFTSAVYAYWVGNRHWCGFTDVIGYMGETRDSLPSRLAFSVDGGLGCSVLGRLDHANLLPRH